MDKAVFQDSFSSWKMRKSPFICHEGYFDNAHAPRVANWHKDPEILACYEGEGSVFLDTRQVPFFKGDVVFVNADTVHRVYTEGSDNIRYRFLIVDEAFFEFVELPVQKLRFCEYVRDRAVFEAFDDIVKAYETESSVRAAKSVEALSHFLSLYASVYPPVTRESGEVGDPAADVREAIRYIRAHLDAPMPVEEIASHVGLSRAHFSRLFKRFTGRSLVEYCNVLRCEEARKRIAAGETVSDAARACGFSHMSYFSAVYKRFMGVSPSSDAQDR